MGRTYKADAIVLRSLRFGEADRMLHLYTAERGRVNAIAKGVRKTTSRFGGAPGAADARRSSCCTRAGASCTPCRAPTSSPSHAGVREQPYALAVALIGAEAVLKLFPEPEPQPRVFDGLVRFLDLLDRGTRRRPDPACATASGWASS